VPIFLPTPGQRRTRLQHRHGQVNKRVTPGLALPSCHTACFWGPRPPAVPITAHQPDLRDPSLFHLQGRLSQCWVRCTRPAESGHLRRSAGVSRPARPTTSCTRKPRWLAIPSSRPGRARGVGAAAETTPTSARPRAARGLASTVGCLSASVAAAFGRRAQRTAGGVNRRAYFEQGGQQRVSSWGTGAQLPACSHRGAPKGRAPGPGVGPLQLGGIPPLHLGAVGARAAHSA